MSQDIKIYKEQMDDDFKKFPLTTRFYRLEKAWIRDLSHKIMKIKGNFVHNDRKEFRKELYSYLDKKIKGVKKS